MVYLLPELSNKLQWEASLVRGIEGISELACSGQVPKEPNVLPGTGAARWVVPVLRIWREIRGSGAGSTFMLLVESELQRRSQARWVGPVQYVVGRQVSSPWVSTRSTRHYPY